MTHHELLVICTATRCPQARRCERHPDAGAIAHPERRHRQDFSRVDGWRRDNCRFYLTNARAR